jgi:hypothetical protein
MDVPGSVQDDARGGPVQRLPDRRQPGWKQLQTVVIDKDGVEITGFIFADNYFEPYVNGYIVARTAWA